MQNQFTPILCMTPVISSDLLEYFYKCATIHYERIISPHIVLIFLPCVVMLHIITCYSFIERIQCSIFLLLSTNLIKKQNQQCVHFLKQQGAAGFSKHYSKRVNGASFRNYFSCRFGYTSGYLWKHLE